MSGNSFGTIFKVTTFGESHGTAVGCIIDGCPAGLPLAIEDIAKELRRRRPGTGGTASSSRSEEDVPEILSGLYQGKTLGTPIAVIIKNNDQKSDDYKALEDCFRPGHADWSWEAKYGFRDPRGGGRSSGRETAGRVAAGAVAKVFLAAHNITIKAWTAAAAGIEAPCPGEAAFDMEEAEKNPLRVPCKKTAAEINAALEALKAAGNSTGGTDSAGGIVACSVSGLPPGLGEPVFDKLDALLGHAILSIGACKGIEFGTGFAAASAKGSENNDAPLLPPGSALQNKTAAAFKSNNCGGILGGISNSMDVFFRAAFKPTPSISKEQSTIDKNGAPRQITIQGRHDICLVPRVVPVVEAMSALVIADLLLIERCVRV